MHKLESAFQTTEELKDFLDKEAQEQAPLKLEHTVGAKLINQIIGMRIKGVEYVSLDVLARMIRFCGHDDVDAGIYNGGSSVMNRKFYKYDINGNPEPNNLI